MDTHRLPPGAVVLEGPGPSWTGRLLRWRLGSPWGHCWTVVDAWTGIEAVGGGVTMFDPLERFASLEQGRAFVVCNPRIPDYLRARYAELAPAFLETPYRPWQVVTWALTRWFFRDRPSQGVICSHLCARLAHHAAGRHGFEDATGESHAAAMRRHGYVTPDEYLRTPHYDVIDAVQGVGRWAVADLPIVRAVNPWADRFPLGSPRPPRQEA